MGYKVPMMAKTEIRVQNTRWKIFKTPPGIPEVSAITNYVMA